MARVASQLTQMGFLELALDCVQAQARTANKSHCLSAFLQSWSVEQLICRKPWQQALSKNKTVSTFQDPFSPCCSPEKIMLMLWWGERKKHFNISLRACRSNDLLRIKVFCKIGDLWPYIILWCIYHNWLSNLYTCSSLFLWNNTCIVN